MLYSLRGIRQTDGADLKLILFIAIVSFRLGRQEENEEERE